MSRIVSLVFGFVILFFPLATARAQTAKESGNQVRAQAAKLAEVFIYSNSISADGTWRPDNLNDKTELAFDAATHLECYRHGGRDLVDTDAYCVQMTASIVLGMPDIDVDYFPVLTWDADKIIAADSSTSLFPVCTWTQITVNLQDHSIMATDTRKLVKGHEGINNACEVVPLAQTYHLVEKVQELTRRRLRAEQLEKHKK
jgi:hypothetical protein